MWYRNRHIDQWNRIESPEINPQLYGQLIFGKGGKSIQWSKDSFLNKWCWDNWTDTWEKMKLNYQFIPYTQINSKWIKDINVSCKTIKILEENIDSKISDILHRNIFANISPQRRETKEK